VKERKKNKTHEIQLNTIEKNGLLAPLKVYFLSLFVSTKQAQQMGQELKEQQETDEVNKSTTFITPCF
jgi:hypothetical protein